MNFNLVRNRLRHDSYLQCSVLSLDAAHVMSAFFSASQGQSCSIFPSKRSDALIHSGSKANGSLGLARENVKTGFQFGVWFLDRFFVFNFRKRRKLESRMLAAALQWQMADFLTIFLIKAVPVLSADCASKI